MRPVQRPADIHRRLPALALALALALGTGCAAPPPTVEYQAKGDGPDTADGLYRVRTRRVGAAFLKPGASLADYDSVLIDPVTVSYKLSSSTLDAETMARFKRIFQEVFEGQLSRSQVFAVVSGPGPRALRVSGHIVNLVVTVPRFRAGETSFVLDSGEMTLVLDVRDSRTGEPLARIADRRLIRPTSAGVVGGFQSNAVNNWGAVRDVFTEWARFLREGLDGLHELTFPPAPGG